MSKTHSYRFLAVALPLLLAPLPSRADSKEERERAARKACLTGDTAKGVDLLADLFLDTRDFTHIFNQGRCYEQNQQYREAIGRFREYLVKGASLSAEEKADAQKHIEVCQSYLDRTPAAPVPVRNVTARPTSPPPMPAPALDLSAQAAPGGGVGESRPFYTRWWFWGTVGAVVVAGAVTAVVLSTGKGGSNIPGSSLGNQGAFP